MARNRPKIIVTSGEPAGIGPDICIALGQSKFDADITVLGDPIVFSQRASQLRLDLAYKNLKLVSVNTLTGVQPGRLENANAPMVLEQLDLAVQACLRKQYDAMVTAPVHKGVINEFGHAFTGHTEYLARKCGEKRPVMMLTCEQMRVALVTTHLPLAEVEEQITQNTLIHTLEVLYNDLRLRFGIEKPRIAVCGLNPHAGEQGHLGRTELDIIEPTLKLALQSGMDILGPLPADTAFTPKILEQVDAVLTMYHDQGLPVLKYASFGKGVNVTLGLPVIRTSVDHGTALDLAGSGRADPSSLIEAIHTAIDLVNTERAVRKGHYKRKPRRLVEKEINAELLAEGIDSGTVDFEVGAPKIKRKRKQANPPVSVQPPEPVPRRSLQQNDYVDNDMLISAEEIGLIGLPQYQEEDVNNAAIDDIAQAENHKDVQVELDRTSGQDFFSELDILKALKDQDRDRQGSQPQQQDKEKKKEADPIDEAIRTMTDIVY